jgi:hypothetical protein
VYGDGAAKGFIATTDYSYHGNGQLTQPHPARDVSNYVATAFVYVPALRRCDYLSVDYPFWWLGIPTKVLWRGSVSGQSDAPTTIAIAHQHIEGEKAGNVATAEKQGFELVDHVDGFGSSYSSRHAAGI